MDVIKGTADRTFTIDFQSGMGFIDLLQEAFNGSTSTAVLGPVSYTSDTMQALYQTDDLSHLMDTVAASLSSHIRTISSEAGLGKMWAMETYVHVRWIWFMLPMTLVLASLVFLFTAIWTIRSRDVGIWKSSGLAMLFQGLENILYASDLHQ
jgi:hypothetical protein